MPELGVMEIFFGSPWEQQARLLYAEFLADHQFASYLYGPKADAHLRRRWRDEWPSAYVEHLEGLSHAFRGRGVKFGVCFSPMGYQEEKGLRGPELLRQKMEVLNGIGIDTLGLFFDDMPVHAELAETQLAIVKVMKAETDAKILFCPSFYSPDPILEKVFGACPPHYLETLAAGLAPDIEIAWTGPKVISPEITAAHLSETAQRLGRAPSLCDNFFANDGPKNCKFLKLKTLTGRAADAFQQTSSWYFNPMNEAALSKVLLRASQAVLAGGADPAAAWAESLTALCPSQVAELLLRYQNHFLDEGLDSMDPALKAKARAEFSDCGSDPVAREVCEWLDGKYTVGSDCLTD